MDKILGIYNWIMANKESLLAVITSTVTIASIIVRLTPTPKDDALLAKVMPWIEKIALNKKA